MRIYIDAGGIHSIEVIGAIRVEHLASHTASGLTFANGNPVAGDRNSTAFIPFIVNLCAEKNTVHYGVTNDNNDENNEDNNNRRPIAARGSAWAQDFARALARSHISPNQISAFSVVCALAGVAALIFAPPVLGLIAFAVAIQARLICNLLDGMVAIEGGKKSVLGGLYNEFPDRIADSLFIVAVGYTIHQPWLGWWGALAAALTAYVRVFGGSLGLAQNFRGPMAKQHRMAVLTIAALLGAAEWYLWQQQFALVTAAYIVAIGASITCVTRTRAIAQQLRDQHG